MPAWAQLLTLWRGLPPRQQWAAGGGAFLCAATVLLFAYFMSRNTYKTLYSDLSPAETQAIAQHLETKNIPYEISADGASLRVPADKLDAIRLDMAAQGLPQSGRLGFELFDRPNWVGSEFTERVNYQRALEGELERTIQTIEGVEAVRVHLVLPQESLFSESAREAKASVVLRLRHRRLSEDSLRAITHLVSSSVDGLQPQNVAVVDATGRAPMLQTDKADPQANPGPNDELARKLIAALAPIVGPEGVRASVNVEYALSSSEVTDESYDPNRAVLLTSQLTEERVGEPNAAGIPGTATNIPTANDSNTQTTNSEEFQVHRTENRTYAVSRTIRRTLEPPGSIRKITAAVLVDDAVERAEQNGRSSERRRKRTPEEMRRIEEIAAAAIGIDRNRGDQLAVENLAFEAKPAELPESPVGLERYLPTLSRMIGNLRHVSLLLLFVFVYLLLIRPLKRQMTAALRQPPNQVPAAESRLAGLSPVPSAAQSLPEGGKAQEFSAAILDNRRASELRENLVESVKKEPLGASRVIQNWIASGEENP